MPARSRPTNRFRTDDPRLREAVLAKCRAEFEAFAGRPWEERFGAYGQRDKVEKEARQLFVRLRRVLLEVSKFASNNGPRGLACNALKGLAEQVINPALRRPALATKPTWNKTSPLLSGRAGLIRVWEQFNILGLPPRSDGDSRMFSARELAVISLLSGNSPKNLTTYTRKTPDRKITAANFIDAERQIIARLLEKHGAKWTEAIEVDGPDGPSIEHVPSRIRRGPDM